jgi:hypothetical protein
MYARRGVEEGGAAGACVGSLAATTKQVLQKHLQLLHDHLTGDAPEESGVNKRDIPIFLFSMDVPLPVSCLALPCLSVVPRSCRCFSPRLPCLACLPLVSPSPTPLSFLATPLPAEFLHLSSNRFLSTSTTRQERSTTWS